MLRRKYANQWRLWLAGGGAWPLQVPLGCPTELAAGVNTRALREWVLAWQKSSGPGEVLWRDRHWRTLGVQSIPEKVTLESAAAVAASIGEEDHWRRTLSHYTLLSTRWPRLAAPLLRSPDAWADYSADDFVRLESLLSWIESNPRSDLYPRQIPLAGMDTKWLEPRIPLITGLVGALRSSETATSDFYESCGLKQPPRLVRLRLLDPRLRSCAGGLGDISAPIEQLAALRVAVSTAYIVENVQTGLCFGDIPGAIVLMGLGYGASVLGRLPWLAEGKCIYWGDLDTHGFGILSRARQALPNLISALMDESTLLRHRALWTEEKEQASAAELPLLTPAEQAVYRDLKMQRWGTHIRLEQERIPWNEAWEALD